jgi:N-acetyltransferase
MNQPEQNQPDLWSAEKILEGRRLNLEPLALHHLDDLEKNLLSTNAWHCVHWGTRTRAQLEKGILGHLSNRKDKISNSFAMVLKSTGKAVGLSTLMKFDRQHNRLEIGATWIGKNWHKTFVNTEAKFLMLSYSFETLGVQRVEFRVDALNFNSQRAVLRLGAKYEGELRQVFLLPDGRKRDYKIYSILDSEWSNIKITLLWYLNKYV